MIQLFEDISMLLSYASKLRNRNGEDFNLFHLLGAEYDEVRTHSAIIADLLDPKGTHGQGNRYLNLYIEGLKSSVPELQYFDTSSALVFKEYFYKTKLDAGRIDIFIQDKDMRQVIIENKIQSGENNNQIERYRKAYPKSLVIFLTLFGDDHNQANIIQSYHTEIYNWLENCRKESIDLGVIKEAIAQYIYLIKKLTNRHIHSIMDKEIQQRILRDENSLSNFLELTNYFDEIKRLIHIVFFKT